MRLVSLRISDVWLLAGTVSLAACTTGGLPLAGWDYGWPPTSSQCVRNEPVAGDSIGAELTRIHRDRYCVSQSSCEWVDLETRLLPDLDPNQTTIWMGEASHAFSIAEQNDIIGRVRATVKAIRPPGKHFYRLDFVDSVITDTTGNPSVRVIQATAYYASCKPRKGPPDIT
ncbi:MAG: hypothetical protein ACJ8EB_13975 [Allosphingosinicella sp.]